MQLLETLSESLGNLPAPRNDYEIVVPENGENNIDEIKNVVNEEIITDKADINRKKIEDIEKEQEEALKQRSQVIQKKLPRPNDINTKILRSQAERQNLTDLQKAEELIKHEMVAMLLYDSIKDPIPGVSNTKSMDQLQNYFKTHNYEYIAPEDLQIAKRLLNEETKIVAEGMGHGELPMDVYAQVWQECYSQVLYLPSQNRYTRANLASKKDRLESAERRLEQNRRHMAKEARNCGKMEKKLKLLTTGYQTRAQVLIKQLEDAHNQIEQNSLALLTFQFLAQQEAAAIPRRLESFEEDVKRQMEREKELQQKYAKILEELKEAKKIVENNETFKSNI